MANTKFKVIAPKGVSIGGVSHKKGETFTAETKSAHVRTALHFKQIEPVSEAEAESEAKAEAKAAAKAEAEAKAKAETEAKANK